jgi:hypothetical protein
VDSCPRPRLSPPTRPAGAKKTAVRRNKTLPHACRANSPTICAQPVTQGAISRRYPRVLQAIRAGSGLMSSTQAESAARLAGASEIAPLFLKHEINGAHHA